MATAAPPLLSDLAGLLLRRPPSLQELIARLGCAEDYAWFTGLVRRLFPEEAEAALAVTGRGREAGTLRPAVPGTPLPLYAPFIEFYADEGEDPPFTWLRRGIPFQLMGFGYDGLHEMWDGYREGISALALLAQPPDAYYDEPGGLRTAWLECAAQRIPQGDAGADSQGRHSIGGPDRSGTGNRLRGSGPGRRLGAGRDRQLLPRPLL